MPNDLLLSGDWPTIIQTIDTTENNPAFINPVCSNLIDVYSSSEKPNFGYFDEEEKEEEDLKLGCINPNDILSIASVKKSNILILPVPTRHLSHSKAVQ